MANFWTEEHRADPRPAMPSALVAIEPAQGGLVAGNLVATERGWVAVEQIRVGDRVMSFDCGLQSVSGVTRRLYPYGCPTARALPLVSVPAGLLGNTRPMLMLPDQPVLVESDLAEDLFGDAFAPVRAAALGALPGVVMVLPEASVIVVTLGFDREQAIYVNGQALAVCAAAAVLAPLTIEEALFAADDARYPVIEGAQGRRIAATLASRQLVTTTH